MVDRLSEIFSRQREYMLSLKPIYEANGFGWHSNFPYPLDERWSQEGFRLLAWRITEEIGELLDAYTNNYPKEALFEEAADVLHFIVELCICTGVSEEELVPGVSNTRDRLVRAFFLARSETNVVKAWTGALLQLTKAIYRFRQRPWRTDNRATHRGGYLCSLRFFFEDFLSACKSIGMTPDSLYDAYFGKSKINDRRTAEQIL